MSYKDYYRVLEVGRDASAQELQRAYRKLARKYHPDVSKEADAEARFKEIQEAYEVLKDPAKRRLYDKYGTQWKAISEGRAPPRGGYDASDVQFDFGPFGFGSNVDDLRSVFEQVFAQQRPPGARRSPPRGAGRRRGDQESPLELAVTEAYAGGSRELQLTDPVRGGPRRLTVQVPEKVRDGQRIRLSGQGAGGSDLYLVVKIVPGGGFRLEGDDVLTSLRISPPEAVLGTTAELVTLDGRAKVKIPPGSSTGRRIRLRGRGYPNRAGERGDLYAEIQVVVPAEPSEEERTLYARLAEDLALRSARLTPKNRSRPPRRSQAP